MTNKTSEQLAELSLCEQLGEDLDDVAGARQLGGREQLGEDLGDVAGDQLDGRPGPGPLTEGAEHQRLTDAASRAVHVGQDEQLEAIAAASRARRSSEGAARAGLARASRGGPNRDAR